MKYIKKQGLNLSLTLFLLTGLISCKSDTQPIQPGGNAQVTLNIVFAQSNSKSSAQADIVSANSVISQVTASVVNVVTDEVVIREQELSIVDTPQGRFAEGELSVPISGEGAFSFIIFAIDLSPLRFFVGTTATPVVLQPGENDPVEITVQPAVPISGIGTVSASSIFGTGFEPTRAIDLDFSTSWFSAGSADPNGNSSIFTWNGPQDIFIATVGIFNNSLHENPEFRQGFGFSNVDFQVLDAAGNQVFEETVDYPSGIIPVARVSPLRVGRSIQLRLNDHQDPQCGGFSELLIIGFDPQGTPITTLLSIDITPINQVVEVGQTVQFNATGRFSDGSTSILTNEVNWRTSDPGVVSINSAGVATAIGPGTAIVSATQGGISGQTSLTVNARQLQSIAISPQNPTIDTGQTQQFNATGTFSDNSTGDITNLVTWGSSDPNVATINTAGLATAVAAGQTTISATQGNISNQTTLSVNSPQLSAPTISNLQAPLVQLNDSTRCDVFDGPIGSLYDISFDYTDADGDVDTSTVSNYSFVFQPSGFSGTDTFKVAVSGDGFNGTINIGLCTVFGDQVSVDHTFSITDAGGQTSNSLTVTIDKPEGANSPSREQQFRPIDFISQVAVCSKP